VNQCSYIQNILFFFSSCQTSISCQHHSWIIDTGATDHMINSVSLFTSITATISTKVKLPNGNFALVTHRHSQNFSTFDTH
jgi:hypothetical protein